MQPLSWYSENNVIVRTNEKTIKIDTPQNVNGISASGTSVPYETYLTDIISYSKISKCGAVFSDGILVFKLPKLRFDGFGLIIEMENTTYEEEKVLENESIPLDMVIVLFCGYERTSVPNVYTTGEVTLYGGMIYGLVVLGYDMEDFDDDTERLCQTSRSYEIKVSLLTNLSFVLKWTSSRC
ncbi:12241_t:CDS:2 [Funneliformis caledonium]|uniref:12241_t:CDS:1 n=1 Tax=Funneliformis caledonium TaxID=1117310 RepID=A0A9N8WHQ5_9GLOM|nr:12241_t:CDS:2 [Funneliformis caledonium]